MILSSCHCIVCAIVTRGGVLEDVLGLGLEDRVYGLGLEASSPRKLPFPRLKDSTFFWVVKSLRSAWQIFWKTVFFWRSPKKIFWRPFFVFGDRLKNFPEDLFFWDRLKIFLKTFFLESTWACVLGPWPREGLSSVGLSLASTSDIFCVLGLGLEPCVLDSTSGCYVRIACLLRWGKLFCLLWKLLIC